ARGAGAGRARERCAGATVRVVRDTRVGCAAAGRRLLREPARSPRALDPGGVPALSAAAVVARERMEQVSLLEVEVVPEDGAAVAQVGLHAEQAVARPSDLLEPERHHLHQAAGAGRGDRKRVEVALDLYYREHEL